jgi:hypothetical protein
VENESQGRSQGTTSQDEKLDEKLISGYKPCRESMQKIDILKGKIASTASVKNQNGSELNCAETIA